MEKSEQRHICSPGAIGVDGVVRKTNHSQAPVIYCDGGIIWMMNDVPKAFQKVVSEAECIKIYTLSKKQPNFLHLYIRFMDLSASFQKVMWICLERELS